ncbi:cellulose binding domain-containing protein [Cellvibrio sp. UBA7671]|uniref:rhamnogalacturonan lyase family protein n=1 Tax=Cellvibrio sp. UBA7671 TaxID=1946312 RepID=UPI002F35B7BB
MIKRHPQPWLRKTLLACLCAGLSGIMALPSFAARQAEYLDRGVVALPSGSGVLISWRMLGNDPASISFNVYRNGSKITAAPITNSTNYLDTSGTTSAAYTVRAVINGTELAANPAKATWANPYLAVNLNRPNGGTTPSGEAYTYAPNDLSVGDLDGDGEYEIVVKWDPSNAKDNSQSGYTGNVIVDAYEMNGTRLWRIDLGKNIRAGAHYTQFMVYDLDGDGKAEVAMKTAPGTRDAAGTVQGGSNANTDYRNASGYILSGPEYLTVFNGQTGVAMASTDYLPARGTVSSWGDGYGNRVDRFLAGIAYLDGTRPSLVFTRGYYTRAVLVAWDWRNGQLTRRWTFDSTASGNGAAAGQGAHSLTVGDVDQDGKDEIVYGAATINDNGTLMYSTGFGHGDALHLSDFIPSRPGLEVFMVHESNATGVDMHDAKTGQVIWSLPSGGADVGRGVIMDIDPRTAGAESWASVGGLNNPTGGQIGTTKPASTNFAAWWDGDLLREQLNNTMIDKWNYSSNNSSRLLTAYNYGAASNNGTKSTPGLSADLLGDWREEVIWRHENNSQLLIFSTPTLTTHKLRTLMHDTQYRTAIAWQNVGYNQPPHTGFFLGDGMATPAAPDLYFVGTNPNATTPASSSSVASSKPASSLPMVSSSRSSSSVALSSSSRSSTPASSIPASSRPASSVASSIASSRAAAGSNCSYTVSNNWGAGFTGAIRITNRGTSAINGWSVSWTYAGSTRLSGTWNATVTGTNPYSATNLSWNSTIQPGQSVEFGFQGTHSGTAEIPVITGSACQ